MENLIIGECELRDRNAVDSRLREFLSIIEKV
jgi:hypothetical protein